MHTNLIVDLNNGIFRTRYAKIKTPSRNSRKDPYAKELIFKELTNSIVSFSTEFRCDAILIACDSPGVWRRDVYAGYKTKEEEKDVYYDDCIEASEMCKEFFSTCTNASVIQVPKSEADDIIGIFCQENPGTVKNIILSSDRDFVQLINDYTLLYSPQQKTFRSTENADYDLFLKCIRGDANDTISSAYPKVWESKLKEAWENPMEMQNIMETINKDGTKVYDIYERNKKLIDLTQQPDYIKQAIKAAIYQTKPKTFTELKVMKYFADHNLKEFYKMLSGRYKPLRGFVRHK